MRRTTRSEKTERLEAQVEDLREEVQKARGEKRAATRTRNTEAMLHAHDQARSNRKHGRQMERLRKKNAKLQGNNMMLRSMLER